MAVRNRWLAQLALFLLLAVIHTWPLASDPGRLSRLDNDDTAFNTWVVAWVAHVLPRDPLHLFQAPIFYPEKDTLAYSEHMLVQSVMGAPLLWLDWSPVLVFNLLVMAGFALSGWSMSLLIRNWTGSTAAGIVAGTLFAFNAHLLTRFAHLQALHMEFIPPALYALDRLLERATWRYALLLTLAFVTQALCSNYTMVFLAAALVAAALVRPDGWWRQAGAFWPRAIVAALAAVLLLTPVLLPYYRVHETQGLVRSLDEVRTYSAGWRDYLTTGGRLHYALWSHRFFNYFGTALFPGVLGTVLALLALGSGRGLRDRRARMAVAFGLLGLALSFGPATPGYAWAHEHVPILQGIRAAARWGILPLTAVAILAGFGVQAVAAWRLRPRVWAAAAAAMIAIVSIEAMRAPLGLVDYKGIPRAYDRLRDEPWGPIVIFPLYRGGNFHLNGHYLIEQTRHFRPMINGYSSFAPASFHERAARLEAFPAPQTLAELRSLGVTHVLLDRTVLEPMVGADNMRTLDRMPQDFTFVLEEDGVMIYRLLPR